VYRLVEVEDSKGQGTQGERRFVVMPSSQLAQQHTQAYSAAPAKEAEAVVAHITPVHARWCACAAAAVAAIAA
jgi:hypothetical protein